MKVTLNIITVVLLLISLVCFTLHFVRQGEPSLEAICGIISGLLAYTTFFINITIISVKDCKLYNKLTK